MVHSNIAYFSKYFFWRGILALYSKPNPFLLHKICLNQHCLRHVISTVETCCSYAHARDSVLSCLCRFMLLLYQYTGCKTNQRAIFYYSQVALFIKQGMFLFVSTSLCMDTALACSSRLSVKQQNVKWFGFVLFNDTWFSKDIRCHI